MGQLRAAILASASTLALACPATAFEDYDACAGLVATNPARAEAAAADWVLDGGGWPARHCRALALEALGAWRAAALALTEIGQQAVDLPKAVRVEIFADAARLFLDVGALDEAGQVTDAALQLAPESRAARLANAALSAELGDWRAALSDLDRAIASAGADPELLALRASAKRRLGDRVGARADAQWAVELGPDRAEAWLELGETEAGLGNRQAASGAWLKALELSRGTALAEIARRKLQRLASE